jgi:Serine carboxypeptidase S28
MPGSNLQTLIHESATLTTQPQTPHHYSQHEKCCFSCLDQWWHTTEQGPILFYTGNEGDIVTFWNNTGFMFEIAPQLGALIIFAEHVCTCNCKLMRMKTCQNNKSVVLEFPAVIIM